MHVGAGDVCVRNWKKHFEGHEGKIHQREWNENTEGGERSTTSREKEDGGDEGMKYKDNSVQNSGIKGKAKGERIKEI